MPSLTIQTIINRGTIIIKNPNASPIQIQTPPKQPSYYSLDNPDGYDGPRRRRLKPPLPAASSGADIMQWVETFTGLKARLVYDSAVHGLGGNQLWARTHAAQKVAFVFKTQGNVFGSFHAILPKSQGEWVDEDPEHFVFTLKNPFNVSPTRFDQRKPIDDGVLFIPASSTELMNIGYLCYLAAGPTSFVRLPQSGCPFFFTNGYADHTNIGDVIFTGSTHPTLFELDHVLAFAVVGDESVL